MLIIIAASNWIRFSWRSEKNLFYLSLLTGTHIDSKNLDEIKCFILREQIQIIKNDVKTLILGHFFPFFDEGFFAVKHQNYEDFGYNLVTFGMQFQNLNSKKFQKLPLFDAKYDFFKTLKNSNFRGFVSCHWLLKLQQVFL